MGKPTPTGFFALVEHFFLNNKSGPTKLVRELNIIAIKMGNLKGLKKGY